MMGSMSIWHWLVVLLVIVLLFGAKKIPELAKGLGSGIKTFKKELEDDDDEKKVEQTATQAQQQQKNEKKPEVIEAQVIESNSNIQQKQTEKI
ncbi:twin-arginine translocase TatA/TatE family subunit [Helicobacter trogontum]|uniref:Sec-independent protein translocase protein TatA n=2 Tax=Helicobacter trogontum TaxID=50960 RepID=A0A099VE05_9HELI|nr:Sec-independent protein translocase subunit TatA [Helicobacter trogontum]MDY5184735.1 Sec-independent protein translocase subunit TatA [Helicobacter trogontum]TLD84697.1 twin-arginine translocase TatA/TatE family subunit [Helicobacter trogontum]TLD99508.1 twin-arginine translocase TatA/TatE family subunit [Helicobacter trogontum]